MEAVDLPNADEEGEQSLDECETQSARSEMDVRAVYNPSLTFETVPDKLFDYEANRLPPELTDLDPSDFLVQPEDQNIVFLPKEILSRVCEMLTPKEFGRLASTCRFLHWRMMKFCHCTVKELRLDVHDTGRRSNGDAEVVVIPRWGYNLHRKQLLFERINLFIWVGTFKQFSPHYEDSAAFLKKVHSIFGNRANIREIEITAIPYSWMCFNSEDRLWAGRLLRDTRVRRFNVQRQTYYVDEDELFETYHLEHKAIVFEQHGLGVIEPYQMYLNRPPIELIEARMRHFIEFEEHGIYAHAYFYAPEDSEQLYNAFDRVASWIDKYDLPFTWSEHYGSFAQRIHGSKLNRIVQIFPECVWMAVGDHRLDCLGEERDLAFSKQRDLR